MAGDEAYFAAYGDLEVHWLMLLDKPRVGSYRSAIRANREFLEGKVAMDVGAGTGILTLFLLLEGGCRHVYAVEKNAELAQIVREMAVANGVADRVTVVAKTVEEFAADPVAPATVDAIVSEWMGFYLMHECMLPSVLAARDRWLVADGLLLPTRASLKIAAISAPELYAKHTAAEHAVEAAGGAAADGANFSKSGEGSEVEVTEENTDEGVKGGTEGGRTKASGKTSDESVRGGAADGGSMNAPGDVSCAPSRAAASTPRAFREEKAEAATAVGDGSFCVPTGHCVNVKQDDNCDPFAVLCGINLQPVMMRLAAAREAAAANGAAGAAGVAAGVAAADPAVSAAAGEPSIVSLPSSAVAHSSFATVWALDLFRVQPAELLRHSRSVRLAVAPAAAPFHGFALWFDVAFDVRDGQPVVPPEGPLEYPLSRLPVILSTAPTARPTHWRQTVLWTEPLEPPPAPAAVDVRVTLTSDGRRAYVVEAEIEDFRLLKEEETAVPGPGGGGAFGRAGVFFGV